MKPEPLILEGKAEIYWMYEDFRFQIGKHQLIEVLENHIHGGWPDGTMQLGEIKLTIEWVE